MAEELKVQYPGGSHAPPLSDELLAKYEQLATSEANAEVADAMRTLLNCCKQWWELPESTEGEKRLHQAGLATIQPLDASIQKTLFDAIPWMRELDTMKGLFESTVGEVRHAAHHLLWHVIELCLDREPITTDKLPKAAA